MTLCVGMRCADGLIGIADTRLTSGDIDYVVTGKKLFLYKRKKHAMFIMVSGLKSCSDAIITYLNERQEDLLSFDKIHQGLDYVVAVMREVRQREEPWLARGNLDFNLNVLVGGQFEKDKSAQLFRIYPEGSWTRIRRDYPFDIIGEVKYGKPILDRTFNSEMKSDDALLIALLAFDSTSRSNPMVYPPLDIVKYKFDSFSFEYKRLNQNDMLKIRKEWDKHLDLSLKKMFPKFKYFKRKK